MLCEPTAATASTCYSTILTAFMKSAWRRAVTTAEVQTEVTLATTVQTAQTTAGSATAVIDGLSAALQSVLDSPYFLFHVELGSPNYSLTSTATTPLSDYEIASRLSYFLWGSMPDATLTAAADMGMLSKGGATVSAQVTRMLADPKATSLGTDFAGQWLSVKDDSLVSPDPTMFPNVDNALLASIAPETTAFFNGMIANNAPLTDIVQANYDYVNGRLAQFYGISGVPATQTTFTKVSLSGTQRTAGVLTQETFLTTQAFPTRTSPVLRGNWLLTNMLCSPPPAPPPNVPLFPTVPPNQTVRQTLMTHQSIPSCAGCHVSIDNAGFPFELFDAVGTYRTTDNGQTIDPSGGLYPAGLEHADHAEQPDSHRRVHRPGPALHGVRGEASPDLRSGSHFRRCRRNGLHHGHRRPPPEERNLARAAPGRRNQRRLPHHSGRTVMSNDTKGGDVT